MAQWPNSVRVQQPKGPTAKRPNSPRVQEPKSPRAYNAKQPKGPAAQGPNSHNGPIAQEPSLWWLNVPCCHQNTCFCLPYNKRKEWKKSKNKVAKQKKEIYYWRSGTCLPSTVVPTSSSQLTINWLEDTVQCFRVSKTKVCVYLGLPWVFFLFRALISDLGSHHVVVFLYITSNFV
jgi:hypothetical protein